MLDGKGGEAYHPDVLLKFVADIRNSIHRKGFMAITYIARGVTLTAASLAGPGGLLLSNGGGTFTVDGDRHTLELTHGDLRRPLREDEPVNAVGLAAVRKGIGAFLIEETMSVRHPELPIVAEGPIFLAVKGVREQAGAAAQ
jgi:hypothetical protein